MDGDLVFLIFVVIASVGLILALTTYFLWFALHNILCNRLDCILFREPYFNKSELINYLCWPLSCIRSLNYIGLIAAPRIARKKRFKGFDGTLPIGSALVVACKVEFALMVSGTIMFFVFFGYLGIAVLLIE